MLNAVNLNSTPCLIISDGRALRAAVEEDDASEEDGEMRQRVLAVQELERVTRVNIMLRVLSFGPLRMMYSQVLALYS